MSSNPNRQRLMSPVDYIGLLVGAKPPEEEQEPQNVFDAVYRFLPQQQQGAPMPFPESPPPYPMSALSQPRGIGGGWGS